MKEYAAYLIVGLTNGSIYGLAAMGLTLTFKTSGVFNFAYGTISAASAYVFYVLHDSHSVPWPIALLVCILVLGPGVGVLLELLGRRLSMVGTTERVLAMVGILLGLQGLLVVVFGATPRAMEPFLPEGTFKVGGVVVGYDQLLVVLFVLVAVILLSAFFRVSRTGLAMRATVDDSALLDLHGFNPVRARRSAWVLGMVFAAVSGVLLGQLISLDVVLLTLLVVQAFGAAALGTFSSLPLAYAGGLTVGLLGALAQKYAAPHPDLGGLPQSIPFLLLFAVLLARSRQLPREKPVVAGAARRALLTGRKAAVPVVVAGALAVSVPAWAGSRIGIYTSAAAFVIVFVSLSLLMRMSGQISLCHAAFVGVGAAAFSRLTSNGVPWLPALLLCGLITAPIGAIIAIPAIRLSGLYLALATFGFGIVLQALLFPTSLLFGMQGMIQAPRPRLGGLDLTSDNGYYYVVLVAAALTVLLVWVIQQTRLGRLLRGIADNQLALSTGGTNTNVTLVIVLSIASFLAGIAGALLAALSGSTNAVGFNYLNSLLWLAILAVCGRAPLLAGVVAAGVYVLVPSYLSSELFNEYQPILFGVSALAVATVSGRTSGLHRPVVLRRERDQVGIVQQRRTEILVAAEPAAR